MATETENRKTERVVIARGEVQMQPAALEAIRAGKIAKGDVLATARASGVLAAKQTSTLIPFCHLVYLSSVTIDFTLDPAASRIVITATVRSDSGQAGVSMEAMTAVSVAALTIYDMAKGRDRAMIITNIQLQEKRGGHTGDWQRAA